MPTPTFDPIVAILHSLGDMWGMAPEEAAHHITISAWAQACHRAGAAGEPCPLLVVHPASSEEPTVGFTPPQEPAEPRPIEWTTKPATAADLPDEEETDEEIEAVLSIARSMPADFASRAIVQALKLDWGISMKGSEVSQILYDSGWGKREGSGPMVWLSQAKP